jgi:hypothetical protein
MSDADRFLILDIETVRDEHVLTHFSPTAQSITVPPPIANRILSISFLSGCIESEGHAAALYRRARRIAGETRDLRG